MKNKYVVATIIVIVSLAVAAQFFFFSKNREIEKPGQTSLKNMEQEKPTKIKRQAAVAGAFYPASKEEVQEQISQFLANAKTPEISEYPKVLIVPHAGYVFSGQVGAYGYKLISEKFSQTKEPITVILLGPSHYHYLSDEVVIDKSDSWQTPLGEVEIDRELRDSLVKENPSTGSGQVPSTGSGQASLFKIDSLPHQKEHSLEVQVPFLQQVLSNFKILPCLVNELTAEGLERVSQTLADQVDEKTIIIASSDMSHYPAYQEANYADKKVIRAILTGKVEELEKTIENLKKENIANADTFLCGQTAVKVAMKIAEIIEAKNIKLLKYANSGDTAFGDKSQVVGYSAIVFSSQRKGRELTFEEQKELLAIAKSSVESYVAAGQVAFFQVSSPALNKKLGAFVTLKKEGKLRGCMGRFSPTDIPLYQVVSQMAIAAATQDARFYPVTAGELKDLEYEISVLSPLEKIDNWQKIKIGKHGVEIRQGLKSGVFLPQVATENNWELEEFLSQLCSGKAGLPRDCYKDKDTEIYIFSAQVFPD